MLKITARQVDALTQAAREHAERRIFALLAEHYGPSEVWPGDEKARLVVGAAIDKADHYDMPAERDAFKIAALMLVFGDDFDWREPWALQIVAERLGNAPIAEFLYREGIARIRAREAYQQP
jgi:hypothetical protein